MFTVNKERIKENFEMLRITHEKALQRQYC